MSVKFIERFDISNAGENFFKYEELEVEVLGKNPPPPIQSFSDLRVHEIIRSNIKLYNYKRPTPVQKYAIPILLSKKDLLASAQTGNYQLILQSKIHITKSFFIYR